MKAFEEIAHFEKFCCFEDEKLLVCERCQRTFGRRSNLLRHLKTHAYTESSTTECDYSSRESASKDNVSQILMNYRFVT